MVNVIYLHGFTSSPSSKKAQIFKERFADLGISLQIPDLNVPSFEYLSMTEMLKVVHREVTHAPPGEVILIGSSLGGAVAVNYADKHNYGALPEAERVSKLVLLAPAFDISGNWHRRLGEDGIEKWRRDGWMTVYNYAVGGEARVHTSFLDDVARHPTTGAQIDRPILIFHGIHDDTVSPVQSEAFAQTRVHARLRLLESDHELLDQVETIWTEMRQFIGV